MGQILGIAGSAVSAMGTLAGGAAANQAGQAQAGALEFKAQQQEQQGAEARAAGGRQALEKRKEGRFAMSTMIARAAASGGGATDPTVLSIGKQLAGSAEYNALTETYKGENRARGYEDEAMASRMGAQAALAQGKAAQTASYFSAAGTLIGGIGSAFKANAGVPMSLGGG